MFHVNHFPIQNWLNIRPNTSSVRISPMIDPIASPARRSDSALSSSSCVDFNAARNSISASRMSSTCRNLKGNETPDQPPIRSEASARIRAINVSTPAPVPGRNRHIVTANGVITNKIRPWFRCATPCLPSPLRPRQEPTCHQAKEQDRHRLPLSRARAIPIASIDPGSSRKPAVSVTTVRTPSRSRTTSTRSRVVPASSDTIATSLSARRLIRLDLPAFGAPRITTRNPSLRISAFRAPAIIAAISPASASISRHTSSATDPGTSPSSEKSSSASIIARA